MLYVPHLRIALQFAGDCFDNENCSSCGHNSIPAQGHHVLAYWHNDHKIIKERHFVTIWKHTHIHTHDYLTHSQTLETFLNTHTHTRMQTRSYIHMSISYAINFLLLQYLPRSYHTHHRDALARLWSEGGGSCEGYASVSFTYEAFEFIEHEVRWKRREEVSIVMITSAYYQIVTWWTKQNRQMHKTKQKKSTTRTTKCTVWKYTVQT